VNGISQKFSTEVVEVFLAREMNISPLDLEKISARRVFIWLEITAFIKELENRSLKK